MSSDNKNIYARLLAITDELAVVAKNLTVGLGTNQYKAVSERDVIDAVKPAEILHGVYSFPVSREILESNILDSEAEYKGKVTKKTTFMTRIKTVYRFVNVDNPDDYVDMTTFAEGIDPQDKGSGKAMTYCDKYALLKAYKISTGDDPDQTASEETAYTSSPRRRATKTATEAKAEETPRAGTNGKAKARERLIKLLTEKGINIRDFAITNGLSPLTTEDEYLALIATVAEVENA